MRITGEAKLAGVMGWPVKHSKSPQLHCHWLSCYGIDGAYLPLPVNPSDLQAALRALPKLGFAGVNVTIPHKEAAATIVDSLDADAKRIGAVNTVVVKSDGQLAGSNTDAFGFLEHLRQTVPDWRASDGPAVVLGAGGAARGAAVALLDAGVPEVRFVNRTVTRAEHLVTALGGNTRAFSVPDLNDVMRDAALLTNTTSLGMTGQPPLDMTLDTLSKDAVVYDIVYVPLETPLLAEAAARGNRTVDGLGMLLHQARPGFEAWFGVAPEVTADLRNAVLEG